MSSLGGGGALVYPLGGSPPSTAVSAQIVPIVGLDHAASAIMRLCEYAKGAATLLDNVPFAGINAALIIRRPMFAVMSVPPTIDHAADAIARLCEYAKEANN